MITAPQQVLHIYMEQISKSKKEAAVARYNVEA